MRIKLDPEARQRLLEKLNGYETERLPALPTLEESKYLAELIREEMLREGAVMFASEAEWPGK